MALAIVRYRDLLKGINIPLLGDRIDLFYGEEVPEYTTEDRFFTGVTANTARAVLRDFSWSPLSVPSTGFPDLIGTVGSWDFILSIYSGMMGIYGLGTTIHDAFSSMLPKTERIVGWKLSPMRIKEDRINELRIEISILGKYLDLSLIHI